MRRRASLFSVASCLLWACSQGGVASPSDDSSDMAMPTQMPGDGGTSLPDLATPVDMALPPAEGKPLWGLSYGAQVEDVAVGSDGAIYITGQFSRADFGDGNVTSNGVTDGFLVKLDKVGQRQWARTFGRAFRDVPRKVAVDKSGNSAVVGYSLRRTDTGTHDAMVVSYDSTGGQRYFRTYGGPLDSAIDVGISTAFASDGSLYVTGGFEDRINFGGGDLVSAGDRDVYLLQLNGSGSFVFAKRWGFTSYDQAHSVAVFPDGDVLLNGTGGYPIDFGDGAVGTNPSVDTFLVRFSSQGVARWSKRFRVAPSSTTVATVAPDGNIWMAGDTNIAVDLGGGPRPTSTGRGLFSARFSGSGEHIASYALPHTGTAYITSIAVDSTGQAVMGGAADGDVDFGFGNTTAAAGLCILFKQSPWGPVRWAHRFGGTSAYYNNQVMGVAVTPTDQVVSGGYIGQASTVGSVSLSPFGFALTTTP